MIDYSHLIGKTIVYKTGIQQVVGVVEADPRFAGGVKCNGRSIKNIIDECEGWQIIYGEKW